MNFGALTARYSASSNPLRSTRRVELMLVVLVALLVLMLVWGAARLLTLAPEDPVAPAADALQVLSMDALPEVTAAESNEMRSRPLFWSGRRPLDSVDLVEVANAAETKAAARELREIKLLGVFGSEDTTGIIAMVQGKKKRLMLGESHKGWTLDSVKPNEVVFGDGVRTETLVLKQGVIVAPVAQRQVEPDEAAGPAGNGEDDADESRVNTVPAQANGQSGTAEQPRRLGGMVKN